MTLVLVGTRYGNALRNTIIRGTLRKACMSIVDIESGNVLVGCANSPTSKRGVGEDGDSQLAPKSTQFALILVQFRRPYLSGHTL